MKLPITPSPPPTLPVLPLSKTWLRRLLDETRTRILLLYAATLLSAIAVSIPLFRYFLFSEIDARVRSDLRAERAAFQAAYDDWEAQAPSSQPELIEFIDDYLASKIPEDDNFHIVLLDGEIYRSNPRALPEILQIDSDLLQAILTYDTAVEDSVATNAPEIGRILYKTTLIRDADASRGTFVAVHLSAGEQSEALVGIWIFFKVASGVVVIAFVLAWLGSRQLLKPVQQLSIAAKEINEKTLSQRLEVQGSGELAELAKTFNAMMDRVQHAFETQQRFINDASHELRTPLTIIQGHLEIMDDDPEEQAETIALVMDELERMGRFVSDLLLLAKSERPDFLQLEMIDVPTFMEALFAKVGTLAERTWQLQNLEQGTLVADRLRLTGALINLAQNATQHTQPDALIEIGVERLNQGLRFWVRDTGSGISAADQAHIFDRFARASHTRRRSEGAGLGLAIVKAIAEAHGGHVELTSQLGVGSTFSVILPFEPLLEKPV